MNITHIPKLGDNIRCVNAAGCDNLREGETYTVLAADSRLVQPVGKTNAYKLERFVLDDIITKEQVTPDTDGMYIIVKRTKDYTGPHVYASGQPKTHTTFSAAVTGAQRLAKDNPTCKFFVMRAMAEVQVEQPISIQLV